MQPAEPESRPEGSRRTADRPPPGVPDISVTVSPTAGARAPTMCTALRTGRRFVCDGHLTMELQVSSGALGLGGRPLMEGLLHHAAHGLALTRDIVDVSGGDWRWHNKRYGRLAREVGLTPPARAARVIGMGRCPLSDAEAEQRAEVTAALDAAAGVQLEATVQAVAPPRERQQGLRDCSEWDRTPERPGGPAFIRVPPEDHPTRTPVRATRSKIG